MMTGSVGRREYGKQDAEAKVICQLCHVAQQVELLANSSIRERMTKDHQYLMKE